MAILFAYHIRYVVDETILTYAILTYAGNNMRKFNFRHKNLNKITKKQILYNKKFNLHKKSLKPHLLILLTVFV